MYSGDLRSLCALHKLEELTLAGSIFIRDEETFDDEWEVADGDVFCSLQILYLDEFKLARWIADETNFPRLRRLHLHGCEFEEIPSGIGEILTLQLIELKDCTESVVASAERIVEEQSENGNYHLKLSISTTSTW